MGFLITAGLAKKFTKINIFRGNFMVNLECTVFSEIFDLPNFDILFWLIDFPKISIFSCFCWYTNSVCIANKNIYFFDFLYILWSFDAHGYPGGSRIVFIILLGQLKSAWYDVVEKKKNLWNWDLMTFLINFPFEQISRRKF